MSLNPSRRNPPANQVPVYRFDEARAAYAYEAHTALLDQERRYPDLRENPVWQLIRADTYEQFVEAFGGAA